MRDRIKVKDISVDRAKQHELVRTGGFVRFYTVKQIERVIEEEDGDSQSAARKNLVALKRKREWPIPCSQSPCFILRQLASSASPLASTLSHGPPSISRSPASIL
ncbi:hypothetical protein HPP92_023415 [Vanilla planifolia]|uniref:Uncharacterized protein n=1 Tax=Vanilla planifolia TaxID=51239 RepID=A0A835UEF9_VANPL|nr:hypothetical protein HPP92_023415 [Vanilla planifolia]